MANNRMYLVHRPTGLAVVIGKNLSDDMGWYGPQTQEKMQLFFDEVEKRTLAQIRSQVPDQVPQKENLRNQHDAAVVRLETNMTDFYLAMDHLCTDKPSVATDIPQFFEDKCEPRLLNINENQ